MEYNNEFVNDLIRDLGKKENELTKKLQKAVKEISNLQLIKQRLLLMSVSTQLISLLFLLILFREISMKVK